MAKPTILLVPGSFSSRGMYKNTVDKLRSQGYPALAIDLPSAQKRYPLEPATLQDDAGHIRAVTDALIAEGNELVVVCHSYGGTPTSEGLAGLGKHEGKLGGVKRIIYLTAVIPRVGEDYMKALDIATAMPEGAMVSTVGENQMRLNDMVVAMLESAVGGYMHMDSVQIAHAVGNDLPSWEVAYEWALQLSHHSAVSLQGVMTQAAYESIPVSYILCEKDLIVSPEIQKKSIRVIEEVSGKKVDVISLDAGHCPNWSQPERLAEIIVQEADRE